MKNKRFYMALAIVVLSCLSMSLSLAPRIAGGEAGYGSECSISNVAPVIEESNFFLSSTTACTGESVEFAIRVSDVNGAADVSSAIILLSDDEKISEDDISIQLDRTEIANATTSAFGAVWTAGSAFGLKNILIAAHDTAHLAADNNGITLGTIELNPMSGFVVKNSTGDALIAVSFPGSPPGALNLSSNQNPIQVSNIGEIAINVYMYGTPMANGNETIPISNMRIDEMPMSTAPQLFAEGIEPGASSFHNIYMDYPTAIPAGIYQGTVVFEITA